MAVATHHKKARPEKFGTVIGIAPGNVPAYSSDYDSADGTEYPSRRSYMGNFEGIYTGYRYQCVEFARRWLISTQGITFGDVGMAYEVMRIGHFETVEEMTGKDAEVVPLKRTENGAKGHLPVLGSIILWRPQGFFRHTGHIGVITHLTWDDPESAKKVTEVMVSSSTSSSSSSSIKKSEANTARVDDAPKDQKGEQSQPKPQAEILLGRVGIAEQNVTDAYWPKGSHCARELALQFNTATKEVVVLESYKNSAVLGWVTPSHNLESGGAIIKTASKV